MVGACLEDHHDTPRLLFSCKFACFTCTELKCQQISTPTPSIILTRNKQSLPTENLNLDGTESEDESEDETDSTTGTGKDESIMDFEEYQLNINDLPNDHGMAEKSKFAFPKSDSKMVNELIIDCTTINGIPFTGSLTFDEMRNKIPNEGL